MLNWSQEDMKSVVGLLILSVTSTFMAKYHGTMLSTEELLVNILNLIQLSEENISVVAIPELFQPCISLLHAKSVSLTCQLLWVLSSDSSFKKMAFAESSLVKEVEVIAQSSETSVQLVGSCLQMALRNDPLNLGKEI